MRKFLSVLLCFLMFGSLILPSAVLAKDTEPSLSYASAMSLSSELVGTEEKGNICKYCGRIHQGILETVIYFAHSLFYAYKTSSFADRLADVKNFLKIKRDVTNTNLQGSLGWEGDVDAPIVYVDGSYKLRGNEDKVIAFYEYYLYDSAVDWYCSEDYLPCWVSEFTADGFEWKISNFADKVTVNGNDYELMYTRVALTNKTDFPKEVPSFSQELTSLNNQSVNELSAGETVIFDYCIGADRFGNDYDWPTQEELKALGSFDEHYEHMKNYWNTRLENIVSIDKVPDEYSTLINAYKAGYIYTLIISDSYQLHVGENGYDRVFDHDVIGILATLIELGHTEYFSEYADTILQNIQYPDAAWKFSWPFALYLLKTGDYETVLSFWEDNNGNAGIKTNTHKIAEERVVYDEDIIDENGEVARIMKKTDAIDSNGYWTVDNYSSLLGLTTYAYLCEKLYEKYDSNEYLEELQWARKEYESLLSSTEAVLKHTMEKYGISYIPISMEMPNELTERANVLDANWASVYEFGRWDWDGYIFGASRETFMNELLDDTYEYILEAKNGVLPSYYTMGGYTGVSSGYNAGYYAAALAGERYRTYGIEAYLWLINNGMSCPYGTWECIINSSDSSVWNRTCCTKGWGSSQHMWGQSMNTKVLLDSLIAEKTDGTIIVGRGVPLTWNESGEEISISNFLCENGKRIGFTIKSEGNTITFKLTGDKLETSSVSVELPVFVNNISAVSAGCGFDSEKGTVTVNPGVYEVRVELKNNA